MTPSQTKATVLQKTEQNKHNWYETLENYTTNMHIYEGLSMNNFIMSLCRNGKTIVRKMNKYFEIRPASVDTM